jgi:alkanesulfonate monooxygenase SsuD/methylene tetrahydromethanopterin reductase-like flavin-dependent oxidoreductase (luciferase family)
MRETVGIMKTLWQGRRLGPEMSTLSDLRPFKLEMTPLRPHIPIHIASLNEKAIEQTGEIADGWMPTFWPYQHFQDGIALLERGAKRAGRSVSQIEVSPFVSVVPFDDVTMARSIVKPLVSFYIGGVGDYYHGLFSRYGFRENADQVLEAYNGPNRGQASDLVSDELIDAIAICGPAPYCREKLAEWRRHGVGIPILGLPTNVPAEYTEQFLKDMAPSR